MRYLKRINHDIASGMLFIAIGVVFIVLSRGYSLGTMMYIGPGFMPNVVGVLLVVVGAITLSRGLLKVGENVEPLTFRPVTMIGFAFFAFAMLIERVGLIGTGIVVMGISVLASMNAISKSQMMVVLLFPVLSAIIFIYLLRVPMRYW